MCRGWPRRQQQYRPPRIFADPGRRSTKKSFDNFIALYVGAGQTLAPDWDGDMLYELAQAVGDLFDTTDGEGEVIVNSDVKQLYQSIQRTLSGEDYCQRNENIETLWTLSNQIVARMYVPLVQMLIHSMKQEDQAHKVRMYAYAAIPQLSQCRPSIHTIREEGLSTDLGPAAAVLQLPRVFVRGFRHVPGGNGRLDRAVRRLREVPSHGGIHSQEGCGIGILWF
jgi:hypothetical protein